MASAWMAAVVVAGLVLPTVPAAASSLDTTTEPGVATSDVPTGGPNNPADPAVPADPVTTEQAPEPVAEVAPGPSADQPDQAPVEPSAAPVAAKAETAEPQPGTEPGTEPPPRSTATVKVPGPRTGVVSALRRALRAADRNRRIPTDTAPPVTRLRSDTATLPKRCTAEPHESRHKICPRGDRTSGRTVVVLGDSHVQMLLSGLVPEAERRGVRLVPLIKYGCTPFDHTTYREGRVDENCSSWREWAIRQTRRISPDLVVVGGHSYVKLAASDGRQVAGGRAWNEQWRKGVQSTARRVGERAGRVVVLGDTTTRSSQPRDCATSRRATMRTCEHRMTKRTRSILAQTRGSATRGGAQYLDLNAFTCLDGRCPVVAAKTYIFRDRLGHLTASYADRIAGPLATALRLAS